jgi:hypothetical protein
LSGNKITSLDEFIDLSTTCADCGAAPPLSSQTLSLPSAKLSFPLDCLSHLQILSLWANPVCSLKGYHQTVFRYFHFLQQLDGIVLGEDVDVQNPFMSRGNGNSSSPNIPVTITPQLIKRYSTRAVPRPLSGCMTSFPSVNGSERHAFFLSLPDVVEDDLIGSTTTTADGESDMFSPFEERTDELGSSSAGGVGAAQAEVGMGMGIGDSPLSGVVTEVKEVSESCVLPLLSPSMALRDQNQIGWMMNVTELVIEGKGIETLGDLSWFDFLFLLCLIFIFF